MATTRMIKTYIWEDEWFYNLSEKAQRACLYFYTNKNTEISGIYRLPSMEIEMYLKYKEPVMAKIYKELYPKVVYHDGWVIIPKYTEHQNVSNNVKVQISIEKYLEKVPQHILNIKSEIINHKSEAMDSLSIGYSEKKPNKPKAQENKDIYGEFENVKLTNKEFEALGETLGISGRKAMIEELSTGIASKNYKYANHYATILNWARRKGLYSPDGKVKPKSKYDINS